jgi:hypothetical protein
MGSAKLTPEQRLDRLERITRLFVKAGLRARREGREQDKKIDHLISLQIHNEEKFANQDEKISTLIELQRKNEERFATVAGFQAYTDRRVDALIDMFGEGRNGNSLPES